MFEEATGSFTRLYEQDRNTRAFSRSLDRRVKRRTYAGSDPVEAAVEMVDVPVWFQISIADWLPAIVRRDEKHSAFSLSQVSLGSRYRRAPSEKLFGRIVADAAFMD